MGPESFDFIQPVPAIGTKVFGKVFQSASNQVARGYAPSATVYSLPFGNAAVSGVQVNNGDFDLINGGYLGLILNPWAATPASPGGILSPLTNHDLCGAYKICKL